MENFNIYMLGKVNSNIFLNNRKILQFVVKTISKFNNGEICEESFACFSGGMYEYGFLDCEDEEREVREERFSDFLLDKLVMFKPMKKDEFHKDVENYLMEETIILKKPERFQEDYTYRVVPVFSKKKNKVSFEEFKDLLLNKKWIQGVNGVEEGMDSAPSIIFFEDEEKIRAITGIERQIYRDSKVCYGFNQLHVVEEDEKWYQNFVRSPKCEDIIFVEENTFLEIIDLGNNQEILKKEEEDLKEEFNDFFSQDDSEKEDLLQGNKKKECDSYEYKRDIIDENTHEGKFINNFTKTCRNMNLLYKEEDLINFHTSMKSSKLVILSGMSGTGKSKIVQAYGKALGLKEEGLNFIPVRPSWTDDSDLLGYVDTINKVYRPGDSGFLDTLVEAEKNKDKLYIVCLDEMNLARVEHYFSQILSVLELDGEDRVLKLYNKSLEKELKNSDRYKANIKIGDNILFVGTVNLDESTCHFSDKVLDRANVISLNQVSFLELKKLECGQPLQSNLEEFSFLDYDNMTKKSECIDLTERELELLTEIHKNMNVLNRNVGIGFRIVSQIDSYIRNLPLGEIITREKGIDIQLAQRVLPKLRGTKEQWGEFIGEYYNKEVLHSEILKILDEFKDVSNFEVSRAYILNKARELEIYGYTL